MSHASGEYVKGDTHTNIIEGFWALLKGGIGAQYHQISRRHLDKYVDEFGFRYNNRKSLSVFELTIQKSLGVDS